MFVSGRAWRFIPGRLAVTGLALLTTSWLPTARAHGFGQRYDLPVPLPLYIVGAGATVLFSFVVVALFIRGGGVPGVYPRLDLLRWSFFRALASPPVVKLLQVASVLVFALVLVAGAIGNQDAYRNLAPTVVWVIWWVGFAFVSALLGNIWAVVNPWKILFEWAEALRRRSDPEAKLAIDLPYPERLGVWPGVLLFLAFVWVEIVLPGSARPATIATMMLLYSVVTWGGMILFGKNAWLRHGEAFTLAFGLLARFAPTEVRVKDVAVCKGCEACGEDQAACIDCYACFERVAPEQREINLRPYASGLLANERSSFSAVVFVVLLLSTVTFDGFTATPAWSDIFTRIYPTLPNVTAIGSLGLLAFPILLLALYLATSALMSGSAGVRVPVLTVAKAFVLSLVPIALAYHLAHYLTFLLVQSQLLVPLLSDPFGFGWNLFGTVDYAVDLNVVGAQFAWYTAVISIVVGHIIAVVLAHIVAVRLFGSHRTALRSQYPMLLLMVGYTMISLWILAQPIVEVAIPP